MSKRSAQRHGQTRKQFVALHQRDKPIIPKIVISNGAYIPWEIYHGSTMEKIDQRLEALNVKAKRATP